MSMALDDKAQGGDGRELPELAEPRSTAEVAQALAASGMVDELLAQIDSGQVQITGDGGLLPGLIKLGPADTPARTSRAHSASGRQPALTE